MTPVLRLIIAYGLLSYAASSFAAYSKVSNTDNSLPASIALGSSADDWACTYDSNAQLIWEVKTTDGGLRDIKWTYSWFNADPALNGGVAGLANGGNCLDGKSCDTAKYVSQVNAQGLCGASDWRLPTLGELNAITNADYPSFFIVDQYAENTAIDYWSATVSVSDPSKAWMAGLAYLYNLEASKNDPHAIRLVKNAPPGFTAIDFNLSEYSFAGTWPVDTPGNIAIATDGTLFVVNGKNQQIVHFKNDGSLINAIGSLGSGNGQFTAIGAIAFAPNGLLFAVDQGYRIQMFKQDGTFVASFGSQGSGNGQFLDLVGMAIAPDGTLYTVDQPLGSVMDLPNLVNVNRVQHLNADGSYINGKTFGPISYIQSSSQYGGSSNTFGQISVAIDGSLYILNRQTVKMTAFTFWRVIDHYQADGTFIDAQTVCCATMTTPFYGDVGFTIAPDYSLFTVGDTGVRHYKNGGMPPNSIGSVGQFKTPTAVAVSSDGTLYIADTGNNRVQKFVPNAPQYAYDASTGVALFENITVGNEHYWVKLQNQGNYQFKVVNAYPITPAFDNKSSVYDAATGLVTLPKVVADSVSYQVVLERLGNGWFGLTSAIPL